MIQHHQRQWVLGSGPSFGKGIIQLPVDVYKVQQKKGGTFNKETAESPSNAPLIKRHHQSAYGMLDINTSYEKKTAGKEIVDGLVDDMMLSPIIAFVLEGHNAVAVVRKICGPTNVEEAMPGTIRGDYSHDTYGLANISDRPIITIIHASGNLEDSKKEIGIWFTPDEIHHYDKIDARMHYRKGVVQK